MITVKRADLVKKQLDFALFEDDLFSTPKPMKATGKRNKFRR